MVSKKKKISHSIQIIYVLLIVLIVGSIASSIFDNSIKQALQEGYLYHDWQTKLDKQNKVGYIAYNIEQISTPYQFKNVAKCSPDSSLLVKTRCNTFDVCIETSDSHLLESKKLVTYDILLYIATFIYLAIIVLVVILLVSLGRIIKTSRFFTKRYFKLTQWIGILIIALSICMSLASYYEHEFIMEFMRGTEFVHNKNLLPDLTNILIGMLILFIAEIFKNGYYLQEEQELTV